MNSQGWIIISIIVTWAIILLGVGINWGINREQIRAINKWIDGHETYFKHQDDTITTLRENLVELSTITKAETRRLELFEKALLIMMSGKTA